MLSASAAFATAADATLSEVSDEIAVDEDILTVADEIPVEESTLTESSGDEILTSDSNIVTNDTFFNYFDDSGSLLDGTGNELIFEGDFGELGVNYITIDKPIIFKGNEATFDGITFIISSNDVTIDGFTITQYSDMYAINIDGGKNITLSNNIIDYAALEGFDSYGIYSLATSDLSIINNTIVYVGNTDGTVVNNAIRIEGDDEDDAPCEDIVVQGNTFDITIPSVDVEYGEWGESTVYSEGIVFYYCEGLEFIDNRVDVRYNDFKSKYAADSIYAVSVRSDAYTFGEIQSSDIVISDNNITVDGHACVYPVYVCADDFEVTGNIITSTSETYLAHGIDVDGPSCEGIVAYNVITAEAPVAVYGIYSYQWLGAIEDIEYINNTIDVTGYASAGMEVVECNPNIVDNTIFAYGNYTYGIIASIRDDGNIKENDVTALGSNVGSDATGDPLMPRNSMGISVKGSSNIVDNTVYSTNVGLNFVEEGGTVVDGNTITVENNALIDSYGIYAKDVDDLTFTDNIITYVGYSNSTVVNNAVRIEGDDDEDELSPVTNIKFSGNTFDITLPSVDVDYDWTTYEPTVYSEGIAFYYIEDLEFVNNTVEVRYNDFESKYAADSLYALSVKGNPYFYIMDEDTYELSYPVVSKNVLIADNNINIEGHACAYSIFVGAENLTIAGNDIYASSETYLAHGIDIDSNSADVMVADNTVVAEAPLATYGICADGYMGPINRTSYINNTITVTGYSSIGIKVVVDPSPVISDNTVNAYGNYTYGIIANNGVVSGNTVNALGSNVGSDSTGDSYMQKNSVGISVKATDVINNTVYSTNVGLNIVQEGAIEVDGNTITVENNALIDSYGIYAKAVDNLLFTNNIITYVGYSNGTVVNNAVRIEGDDEKSDSAENIVFDGNVFDISLPSVDVAYGEWGESTVYSEGIVFYYIEDLEFVNNTVEVRYNDVTSAYGYDSIYGVSVRSDAFSFGEVQSSDIVISDNTITVDGHACAYPVYVCADDFEVTGNTITSTSETYLAHGIDVDGPSCEGMVADNTITAEAPLTAYGIYSYQYMGAIEDIEYINNTIDVTGYASAGMEIVECNPNIVDNTIFAYGNYTYGIIASIRDDGIIRGNDVTVLGSNVGSDATGDPIMPKNSMAISVKGNSLIENNTIYSTDIGINLVEDGEIIVTHNDIEVIANSEDIDNHAIVASNIPDLTISYNDIIYVGESTPKENYTTAKAYAVYITNSTVSMENNTLDITVPSLSADWEETPPGSWNYVRHAYTEGIVFDACDGSELVANDITLNYGSGSYGSIYVVDVLDCDNFLIQENVINAVGENYLYGIILQGDDFVIYDNIINVESDYYACGIDIEGPSSGIIDSNKISASAPEDVYPIYSGMNYQPVSCNITNNEISGSAYYGVGIELGGQDATIDNNTITLEGNHTIGIGASVDNLIVTGNTIVSDASNIGDISIWDSMGANTTGIKSLSGTVTITDNNITTTGVYAVDIADCEGTVNNNYLVTDDYVGDFSVSSTGDATVYDNLPVGTTLTIPDVVVIGNSTGVVVATLSDDYGNNVSGVKVKLVVGNVTKIAKTDENGQVSLDVSDLEPGVYKVSARSAKTDVYVESKAYAKLTVSEEKITPTLTIPDVVVIGNSTGVVVATLKDSNGYAIKDVRVKLVVGNETKVAKTDAKGQVSLEISDLEPGVYKVAARSANTDAYDEVKAYAKVTVSEEKITPTLTVPDVVVIGDSTAVVVATLKDSYGYAISGVKVKIVVGNLTKTAKTDKNGQVSFDVSGLEPGVYKVSARSASTDAYDEVKAYAKVTVSEEKITPTLTIPNVEVQQGTEGAVVVATLKDSNGYAIKDVKVKLVVGDLTVTAKTDAKGQVSLDISGLEPGTYKVAARSANTDAYNEVKAYAKAIISES